MSTDGVPRHQVADISHLGAATSDEPRTPTYVRAFSPRATECGFCEDGRFRHPGTDVTEPCPYCSAASLPSKGGGREVNPDAFEASQRSREWFHGLRIPPGMWAVIRVDGRSFSGLTARRGYEKPFDPAFRDVIVKVASQLVPEFGGVYGYTESDEVSLLLAPDWALFDRSVEKAVSLTAACASSVASIEMGEPVQFDSRVWLGASVDDVVDYFSWRAADAARCALNGWCYWTLRSEGLSARKATALLSSTSVADRNELLFERGINFNETPTWQRRGIGFWWEQYVKEGTNPITGATAPATRQRVSACLSLPMGDEYRGLVRNLAERASQ